MQDNLKQAKPMVAHLRDIPSDNDAFGGHDKIANAIKELIDAPFEGDRSYPKKPIGLIGKWGSGKSTVIRALKKLYKESRGVYIFEFDAWLYENDPIRRSFLESLIKFLANHKDKLTTEKEWQNDLDRIRRQKETHVIESNPSLTGPGIAYAVSTVLFALGCTLSGNDKFYADGEWIFSFVVTLLMVSPFLCAAIVWISFNFFNKEKAEKLGMFDIFVQSATDTVINEVIKTPDPTAIEFQDLFSRILGKVFKSTDHKLIIVIDNLDRIPEEKALAMWSTIRSFFVGKEGNFDHYENIWAIVPLDEASVKYMYEDSQKVAPEERATEYLDKTFEIIFPIGPPILSKWEEFLNVMGKQAFPESNFEKESQNIALLYDIFLTEQSSERFSVTPRKIISLINSIGVIYRLHPEIPLLIIAFYCIFRKEIEKNFEHITGEFIYPSAISVIDNKEWRKYIAAIYFNTDPKTAMQLLLEAPLIDAFVSADIDKAEELFRIPGAQLSAIKVIRRVSPQWAKNEAHRLFNISFVLAELESKGISLNSTIWNTLARATLNIESWYTMEDTTAKGVDATLNHSINKASIASVILETMSKFREDKTLKELNISGYWLDILWVIDSHLDEDSSNQMQAYDPPNDYEFRAKVLCTLPEDTPINIVKALMKEPSGENRKTFKTELNKALEERISNDSDFLLLIDITVERILTADSEWEMDPIINGLESAIVNKSELLTASRTLNFIFNKGGTNSGKVTTKYSSMGTRGIILDELYKAKNKDDLESVAMCILLTMKFNPSVNVPNPRGNSNHGVTLYNEFISNPEEETLEHLLNHVEIFFTEEALIDLLQSYQNHKNLINKILNKILEQKQANIKVKNEQLIDQSQNLLTAFSEDGFQKLVEIVAKDRKDFLELVAERDTLIPIELHSILASLKGSPGKIYLQIASNLLSTLTEDEWYDCIVNESDTIYLAIYLREANKNLNLPSAYRTALEKYTIKVYKGALKPNTLLESFHLLTGCMSASQEKTFFVNVRDKILADPSKGDFTKIHNLYGDKLFDKGEFDEKSKADEVLRALIMPMVSSESGVSFVIDNASSIQLILNNAKKETKESLMEDVNNHLKDNFGNDNFNQFEKLANSLKLNKSINHAKELKNQNNDE